MKKTKFISAIFFFASLSLVFAQPRSNLDIIYTLIDKNVDQLLRKLPHETEPFRFSFSAVDQYDNFKNRYVNKLNQTGFLSNDNASGALLEYSLDNLEINYSELFRDGLLGDYKTERKLVLTGTFVLTSYDSVISSEIVETAYKDTIFYSDIETVESSRLAITRGTKPDEPVFESLLEPIIAVGAVIVTIILLFTVRSK